MAFPENIKLEAKRKSHFACVICHQAFVEVHHIKPQADGGSDDLDNAAPLCSGCHDLFGGNPEKRKQIREMRDLWWELCEKRTVNPDLLALNQKLDAIQQNQKTQFEMLGEIKHFTSDYYTELSRKIGSTTTSSQFAAATGVYIPPVKDDLGMKFRGEWSSEAQYEMENVVNRCNLGMFIVIQRPPRGVPPESGAPYWFAWSNSSSGVWH